jgi:hypothetical protein
MFRLQMVAALVFCSVASVQAASGVGRDPKITVAVRKSLDFLRSSAVRTGSHRRRTGWR